MEVSLEKFCPHHEKILILLHQQKNDQTSDWVNHHLRRCQHCADTYQQWRIYRQHMLNKLPLGTSEERLNSYREFSSWHKRLRVKKTIKVRTTALGMVKIPTKILMFAKSYAKALTTSPLWPIIALLITITAIINHLIT